MTKYTKEQFPKIDEVNWDRLWVDHGFSNWYDMAESIYDIAGDWGGKITYEHYCKWFDIYFSPLMQSLREASEV